MAIGARRLRALRLRALRLRALIVAGHPGPCLAITAIIALLAFGAGADPADLVLFAPMVLVGQLSIGWSNDVFDAGRDAAAGRTDKPIVAGHIGRRPVAVAAGLALVVALVLGFVLGPVTGVVNLVMLAAGWAYNGGLKSTVASATMYVVGFGLIPMFATSILPGHPVPRPWTFAAAALLGVGGHFANVLPDLAGDQASGVRGLPQRLAASAGPLAVRLTAIALLLGASVLIVLAPGGPYQWPALVGLAAALGLAVVGARGSGRIPFLAAIGIALLDVVLLVARGSALV